MLGELKAELAIEMSQNDTLTNCELQRSGTQRSDMQITAEIMQTYDLLKFSIPRSNHSTLL